MHAHVGLLAVDVDSAAVETGRRGHLQVDVVPLALRVRLVAVVTLEDSDENAVAVERHA